MSAPREEVVGLHGLQRLIWLGQKLHPDSPAYNLAFSFEIDGEIDPSRFAAAVQRLVEAGDVFRTVIRESEDGAPHQRVLAELDPALETVDLSGSDRPNDALRAWLRQRAAVPFRLDERLFATALLRLAHARWVWFLNQHHIVTDGWSYGLIFRFVEAAYRGSAPSLPRYLDWAAGREAEPGTQAPAGGADGARAPVDPLRFYGAEPRGSGLRERRVSRRLGPERTRALRALASRDELRALTEPLSLLNALTVALAAYLQNVTGASRIAVGVPFHHRSTDAERAIIGPLQRMVTVAVDMDDDDTFASLARKVGRSTWRALRGSVGTGASRGRAPEVLLNLPEVSFRELDGRPVRATWIHPGFGDGGRTLFVQVVDFDGSGELTVHFDASEDVFPVAAHERAADHFVEVIDRMLEDPHRRIRALPLTTPAERERLVVALNRTEETYAAGNLADLFQERVRISPELDALVLGEVTLTYAELDRRANRLARALRARGAAPGARVASCMERSIESIVGLLAVLKSGAAHVPVDPSYPRDRIEFLLEDCDPCLVLTLDRLRALLPATDRPVIALDADDAEWVGLPAEPFAGGAKPEDLGYVIYTSGSTGKPKGVAMSQAALVNLVRWQVRQPTELERPRTLQFTPLTFDVSLQETLSTWSAGGTLVLIPEDVRRDPEATLRLLDEAGIERLFIIFTPFQKLAEAADRTGTVPRRLREVITAGEQLQITPAVRRFFERARGCALHNQYGPSETHIVTAHTLPRDPRRWPALPSIGRPIANTTAYVLDVDGNPVPLGVPGELWIGGAQVADGYLNRPDLTAERFRQDPFRRDGSRVYRTGDLARLHEDGNIEFLGRIDHQIKLRGYRIELGEIETVLAGHESVREAVVTVRGESGEKRLVGYVVPEGIVAGTDAASKLPVVLRRYLLDRLPEPMVPSAFVLLGALPQTPNGKIDRLALPEPDGARPELDADYAPPVGEVELTLASAWSGLLGIDRVGRRDNFFELGGNSLLVVEMHDALRGKLPREVSVVELFRYPTVEAIARHVAGVPDDLAGVAERAERRRRAREGQSVRRGARGRG